MKIDLPYPSAALFPNRANGKHWSAVRAIKDKARDDAYLLTKQQARGYVITCEPVPLTLTFYPPNKIRRDLDGSLSACKSTLDGVAKALGIDDAWFNPITVCRAAPFKGGRLVVEIV